MTNQPLLFGVIGHPVAHSLSPIMHQAAFNTLGLPHHYHAFDVAPENLKDAIRGIKTLGIKGVNVTIPHKENVIPLLDEVDPEARTIGAVNTVVERDGMLYGYNTDGEGYVRSLIEETGIQLNQTDAVMIGAGGAAKAISVYLLKHGIRSLTIINRTYTKAHTLAKQLTVYAEEQDLSTDITVLDWEEAVVKQYSFQLFVQTTPIGMWPNIDQTPLTISNIQPGAVVSDIIYNPLETAFLHEAQRAGATIHSGLGMFIHQGALAFEYFTSHKAPIDKMKSMVLNRLQQGGT
ncbi:shikimate dehydrogenase [Caldalkalibacillus salinus]|uniref:shikimate dehydrogenase n=1 Tax=Caldalkalibacillus salinus TaxID=2803787 RepID=UPI00192063C2|nr:shikimate dehydrogenase [Caldalkalibacillus salinus]